MKQIISGLYVSVDGVVESPEQYTWDYFSPELGQHIGKLMSSGDTLLLGRGTYETFEAKFANDTSGNPVAGQMNATPKVVVSSTMDKAEWTNTTLISDDVANQIKELKSHPGADIITSGSGTLVNFLVQEGLVDELELLVFPVIVGTGKRLFETGGARTGLELAVTEQFPNGVVRLNYRRKLA